MTSDPAPAERTSGYLLIHARDHHGAVFVVVLESTPQPDYPGLQIERVKRFDSRAEALLARDLAELALTEVREFDRCPLCERVGLKARSIDRADLLEYEHRDGTKCYAAI